MQQETAAATTLLKKVQLFKSKQIPAPQGGRNCPHFKPSHDSMASRLSDTDTHKPMEQCLLNISLCEI